MPLLLSIRLGLSIDRDNQGTCHAWQGHRVELSIKRLSCVYNKNHKTRFRLREQPYSSYREHLQIQNKALQHHKIMCLKKFFIGVVKERES